MEKQNVLCSAFLMVWGFLLISSQGDSLNDLKQQNYGLWAAHEYARLAFDYAPAPVLAQKAAQLALKNLIYDCDYKQLHVEVGPSVYKVTSFYQILHIVDYKPGDGNDLDAQIKIVKEGRLYSFFKGGSMVEGKELSKENFASEAEPIMLRSRRSLTALSGVKKPIAAKIKWPIIIKKT